MDIAVFIEPHERYEAIQAYGYRLTPKQIEQIRDAPDGACIKLKFGNHAPKTHVIVLEEETP